MTENSDSSHLYERRTPDPEHNRAISETVRYRRVSVRVRNAVRMFTREFLAHTDVGLRGEAGCSWWELCVVPWSHMDEIQGVIGVVLPGRMAQE